MFPKMMMNDVSLLAFFGYNGNKLYFQQFHNGTSV
jgi:hypothetical protein